MAANVDRAISIHFGSIWAIFFETTPPMSLNTCWLTKCVHLFNIGSLVSEMDTTKYLRLPLKFGIYLTYGESFSKLHTFTFFLSKSIYSNYLLATDLDLIWMIDRWSALLQNSRENSNRPTLPKNF